MIDTIKEKLKSFFDWTKRKIKTILITLGIIGVALAVTYDFPEPPPSVMAEGQVIDFPFADENVGEDFIIWTDQEVYTPLWAWNGFDVYVMVVNESGKTQQVYAQPFFSKNFTIESIAILNETAYTDIIVDDFADIPYDCLVSSTTAATTTCYKTEKVGSYIESVLGRWEDIPDPTFFSEEFYNQFISDNNITVKDKGNRKAKQKFGALFLKDQTAVFKVKFRSNEPFTQEKFDLEIIGDKGGYGLRDPTILTEDFNSCDLGNLDTNAGCPDWGGDTRYQVEVTVVYEGTQAVKCDQDAGTTYHIEKTGAQQATGTVGAYLRNTNAAITGLEFKIQEGNTLIAYMRIYQDKVYGVGADTRTLVDPALDHTDYWCQIDWRSSPSHQVRFSVNNGTPSVWTNPANDWSTGPDKIKLTMSNNAAQITGYIDYIAESPVPAVVVEEEEGVMMIIPGQ